MSSSSQGLGLGENMGVLDLIVLSMTAMRFLKNQNKFTVTMLLCLAICLAAGAWCSRSQAADVAVIRIKYRWASELLPIVQSMLSPRGTVTVSKRINSLIIVNSQDSIQRVRAYLEQFDKPLEQVRIHVRFHETIAAADGSVSARGKISGDNLSAAVGDKKKDGADLSIADRRRHESNFAEFFVFVTTGRPAFIRTGQEIPYQEKWPDYIRHYAANSDTNSISNRIQTNRGLYFQVLTFSI